MAEDGMLINFDLSDGIPASRPKYKGGSWKDKLSAKKSALYHRNKLLQASAEGSEKEPEQKVKDANPPRAKAVQDFPEERPAKKRRTTDDAAHAQNQRVKSGLSQSKGRPGQPKEVISSLFSFNPTSEAPATKDVRNDEPAIPSNAPLADELQTFTSLGLSAHIAEHLLHKMDIKAPTAVQRAAVLQLLKEDSDVFIQAETGSGKTLAYLLPIVQKLVALSTNDSASGGKGVSRESGLFAIILAPTRELSKQISAVLESLLRCAHHIVSGIVIGGEKKKSEKARLRKGLNILIATPGRLADHLDHTEVLEVSRVRWLVLDEGDRLMELGFGDDIKKILDKLESRRGDITDMTDMPGLPSKRVTVLCSATIKSNVQQLGELSLKDAVHVQGSGDNDEQVTNTGKNEDSFSAPAQLQQSYAIVPAKLRLVTLVGHLKQIFARKGEGQKAIVFLSCADSVDFHFELLVREISSSITDPPGTTVLATGAIDAARTTAPGALLTTSTSNPVYVHRLHGSLPQLTRTETLTRFRKTTSPSILISTDLASRGLDLPLVDHILELDPPFAPADHLHRVGRTARAGRSGKACIFLLPGTEEGYLTTMQSLHSTSPPRRIDTDDLLRKGFSSPGLVATSKDWETKATEWQLEAERWVLETPRALEMARRAFQSHIRAYATHGAAERQIFDIRSLHLGHLAKAFALRDRPGNVGVPGMRPGAGKVREERRGAGSGKMRVRKGDGEGAGGAAVDLVDGGGEVDAGLAKWKMREKMREQAAVSEFNLG